jgi:hypothetical protein
MEHIVKVSIQKATLIFHTRVAHGIDDLNKIGHAWMVPNQQHPNIKYKIPLPFTSNC